MNKKVWRPYAFHLLWQGIWVIPIPFGLFASDKGFFTTLSFFMFALASLALPFWLRRRQMRRQGRTLYASGSMYFYGALAGLMLMVGLLEGAFDSALWKTYYSRVALYISWMVLTIMLQNLLAWGFDFWKKRRRQYHLAEYLDPVMYGLPIPCAFFFMIFFPAIDASQADNPMLGVLVALGLCVFVFIGFVLASFALYFYPAKARYPETRDRIIQLLRVLVMSAAWLVINLPASPYMKLIVAHTPLMEMSLLTLVVPFVGEAVSMAIAVACSNLVPFVGQAVTNKK